MDPIIRVYISDSSKTPYHDKFHYQGPHTHIPAIGEHICIEAREHKVWRVEHMLSSMDLKADIFLQEKPS